MAVSHVPSACTGPFTAGHDGGAGVHVLGDVVEVLPDGRARKACTVCAGVFLVEPDAVEIWADLIPKGRR